MTTPNFTKKFVSHKGKYSDKWNIYLPTYSKFLEPLRTDIETLLEIGVQNGGSLEIWSEFLPNAKAIVGCDIEEECKSLTFRDQRIRVIVGDANEKTVLAKIKKISSKFDIIIDDGSHISSDIIKSFWNYFPLLQDGGLFIIEDLHASYWQDWEGGLGYPQSSMQFLKLLADVVNHEHWGFSAKRTEILEDFHASSNVMNESALASIHSVTFVNSMCIIEKASRIENLLGKRVGSGSVATVVADAPKWAGSSSLRRDQSDNEWANTKRLSLAYLQQQLADITLERDELRESNRRILESTSWRITRPIRAAKSILRK